MLKMLRGKYSKLMVQIVLVLITIGFSFFGVESYFVSRINTDVATVDGVSISQEVFRERFGQYRQMLAQQMGQGADLSVLDRPEVKAGFLNQLIDEQALMEANDSLGIVVPAASIRDEIAKIPAFQVDGKFDAEQYKLALMSIGKSPLGFEDEVRRNLAARQLPMQIAGSVIVTDAQIDDYLRLRDERRDFRFIKLDKPAPKDTEVKQDELESWFKAHQAEFMVPERVAIEYVELDASKIPFNDTPDDSVLKERYEKEKARFVTAEQREASHILIKVGGKGGPDEQKAALAKAEDIEKQLKEGKDFAALAKQYSDDLGSKNQGGDLGWLDKGVTEEAFENALFALERGKISAPVLGSEGYHIIELRDVRPGKTRSFDEVKPELLTEYRNGERDRLYSEKAGRLTDMAYQDPSSLEGVARELGLTIQKAGPFPRMGGAGIAGNPAVIKAAFSDSVLVQKNNSDPIDLGSSHIIVLRDTEHLAAKPQPLADVADQVRARILAERLVQQAKAHADSLFAELGKGSTLDAVAAGNGLKVEDKQGIGRDAATLDSALVKAVFTMPRGQDGKPSRELVSLGGDAYALVELTGVTEGNPATLDAKTREAAGNTLRQGLSMLATTEFIASLRKNANIKRYESRLSDQTAE